MNAIGEELLDYYYSYCELTIWFKKISLSCQQDPEICIDDIHKELLTERNRVLQYIPHPDRRAFKTQLNKIIKTYSQKVMHWTKAQRKTMDMV